MSAKQNIYWIILIVILYGSLNLNGQNYTTIDSLRNITSAKIDSKDRIDNYILIAEEFAHYKPDSTFHYINIAINIAEETDCQEGLAEAYFVQGYFHDLFGNYPKAIISLEKSIELFIILKDSAYLSGCYNNLGVIYSYRKNQKKSLEYFIQSVYIGEELQDSFSLAEAYSNIAGFYQDSKEYNSALKYFKKALVVDSLFNYAEDIAISQLDVGYINTKLLRFDEALTNLKAARDLMDEVNDPFSQTVLFQRLALYFMETNEPDSAVFYIAKAKENSLDINSPMLNAETLTIKGEILLNQKRYRESITPLNQAIFLYKKLNAESNLGELYKDKANAYFGLGELNKAYQFLKLSEEKEETLKSYENAEVLSEFEKVQAQKEERARLKLKQELQYHKNENDLIKVRSKLYFTIYLAILLGAILVLALYFFFLKQKHNKSLESSYELINHQKDLIEKSYAELKENEKGLTQLNATKDKFFSIIAHDLKNPFNTLLGISELMISEPDIKHTEDFEELLQGMFQTAQSGHDLLENLLEWSRSQVGNIQLDQQSVSLKVLFNSSSIFFEETAKAKNITIVLSTIEDKRVYADANMVDFIIRNLINNAIKFSHQGSSIEISVSTKDEYQQICVEDSGIGMNEATIDKLFKIEHSIQRNGTNNERGTGLGLILCKEFVEKNDGEIWVESTPGKGSCFCVSLPLSE